MKWTKVPEPKQWAPAARDEAIEGQYEGSFIAYGPYGPYETFVISNEEGKHLLSGTHLSQAIHAYGRLVKGAWIRVAFIDMERLTSGRVMRRYELHVAS